MEYFFLARHGAKIPQCLLLRSMTVEHAQGENTSLFMTSLWDFRGIPEFEVI